MNIHLFPTFLIQHHTFTSNQSKEKKYDFQVGIEPTIATFQAYAVPLPHVLYLRLDGERRKESFDTSLYFNIIY